VIRESPTDPGRCQGRLGLLSLRPAIQRQERYLSSVLGGAVLTGSGLIGITLHAPIGALIDATHFKRALIIALSARSLSPALALWR
jgi:hypothetical protein